MFETSVFVMFGRERRMTGSQWVENRDVTMHRDAILYQNK